MSQTDVTAEKFVLDFIGRNREMLVSPDKWSHQVEISHLQSDIIAKGIVREHYVPKSFSLDEVLSAGESKLAELMRRDDKQFVELPVRRLVIPEGGLQRFLALCKADPKYIALKDWLLNSELLSSEQQLEIYKLFGTQNLKRKRGPKKKAYVRAWHIYIMARELIDNYGMLAYSNRKAPDSKRYAIDFILEKLSAQKVLNITRDDLINDYRTFNRIKFLHSNS